MSWFFRTRRAAAPAPQAEEQPAPVPRPHNTYDVDLLGRALELANDDWTEQEAAMELARVAGGDREKLLAVYERLITGLVRQATLDVRGVRASRIASHAARLTGSPPYATHLEPPRFGRR